MKDEEYALRLQSLNRIMKPFEGPPLKRKGGKYRLAATDSSEEENAHHFDFIKDIEDVVEMNPELPQKTEHLE